MKFHKQRYRHRPEQGEFGDCHRTAIACLLDLEPEQVPNFGEAFFDGRRFTAWCNEWLRANGFKSVTFGLSGTFTVDECLVATTGQNAEALFLFAGTSANGVNHSVIACNGKIIHDPAIDNSGIVGPCDDGLYWFEVLVPIALTLPAERREAA